MRRLRFTLVLAPVALFCACTTLYKPSGPHEKSVYDEARRDVSLSAFRKDPKKYAGQTVAWTGVLKKTEITDDPKVNRGIWFKFFVEGRAFSWAWTTRSGLPAGYLASSNGEGNFEGVLKLQFDNTDKPLGEVKKEFNSEYNEGNFLILYGRPELLQNGELSMHVLYARSIPSSQWFTEQSNF